MIMGNDRRHAEADRAGKLTDKVRDTQNEHSGNRVTADEDKPQPTREPTRDRKR
jgi:hypothetical protein